MRDPTGGVISTVEVPAANVIHVSFTWICSHGAHGGFAVSE
jgi:hypothetical protein